MDKTQAPNGDTPERGHEPKYARAAEVKFDIMVAEIERMAENAMNLAAHFNIEPDYEAAAHIRRAVGNLQFIQKRKAA